MAFRINYKNVESLFYGNNLEQYAAKDIVNTAKNYYDNITKGVPPEVCTQFVASLIYIQKISQLRLRRNFLEGVDSYDDIRNLSSDELNSIATDFVENSGYFSKKNT